MESTELFKKHFGDTLGVVGLFHPNMEAFFCELAHICADEDKRKNEHPEDDNCNQSKNIVS